jgi:iron(III) transport system substrate-binding protein
MKRPCANIRRDKKPEEEPKVLRFVLPALLAVCTALPFPAAADDWDTVIAAARKEGSVNVYNGTNFPIVTRIGKKMQEQYGVEVHVLDGRASDIQERIRSEQTAERWLGDVTFSGLTTMIPEKAEGRFEEHGTLPHAGRIAPPLKDDGTIVPAASGNFGILVNSDMVKPEEMKSWKDLADPKWKNRILSDDPRAAGAGLVWFEVTYQAFGRPYEESVAAQKPVISRYFADSERRVAQGEYPVYFPYNINDTPSLEGLPLRAVVPVEGVPYVAFASAILKNAPHPNAAKLFADFMLTDTAQVMFATDAFRPAASDMADKVPPKLRPLTVDAKLLGTTDPARRDAMIAAAKEIFK